MNEGCQLKPIFVHNVIYIAFVVHW